MQEDIDSLVGRTIGGYEVLEKAGEGAMGVVYRARQLSLDRIIALKVLNPGYIGDEEYKNRFFREARAAASLVHTNIVQVYDVGVEEDIYYIAIEFVDGETLQDILDRQAKLPPHQAIEITRQALVGLQRAQQLGIVHRDIKPDNLMINRYGEVKIADFGLAKRIDERESSITRFGSIVGTPFYMSPEQAQGEDIDHRSDIYSLGATFYHMLTGSPPFDAPTFMGVIMKHINAPLIRPRDRDSSIPEVLSRVVVRMMHKDLARRYQSARELLVALRRVKQQVDSRRSRRRTKSRRKVAAKKEETARAQRPSAKANYKRVAGEFVSEVSERTVPDEKREAVAKRIKDLARGALLVETDKRYAPGTLLELSLRMRNDAPQVQLLGIVKWSGRSDKSDKYATGLQYTWMPHQKKDK